MEGTKGNALAPLDLGAVDLASTLCGRPGPRFSRHALSSKRLLNANRTGSMASPAGLQAQAKLKEMEAAMLEYWQQNREHAGDGLKLLPGVVQLLQALQVRSFPSTGPALLPRFTPWRCHAFAFLLARPFALGSAQNKWRNPAPGGGSLPHAHSHLVQL